MLNRALFILFALFWVTMNVLLLRSMMADKGEIGSAVPVEVVWQKILTAPDNSSLVIRHQDQRIGLARVSASIGEELATGKQSTLENLPEGRIENLTGYALDLDGNVFISDPSNRFRFYFGINLSTNHAWKDFTARVSQRPSVWEVSANAETESVRFTASAGEGETQWERTFTLEQLRNPEKLARQIAGPFLSGFLTGAAGASPVVAEMKNLTVTLKWEANNSWLQIGPARARVYRLRAHLFQENEIVILVSRVGEILKVELPNKITLVNDELKM